jgi:hypothetical protein
MSLGFDGAVRKSRPQKSEMRRDNKSPNSASRPAAKSIAPHLAAAHEILAAIIDEYLPDGEHAFAEIRAEFLGWAAKMRVAPVTDRMLAAWLVAMGLTRYRAGHRKTTMYYKMRRDNFEGAA